MPATWATTPVIMSTSASADLGVNLNSIGYFTPEQPFTNLLNQAGSNSSEHMPHPWFTGTSPGTSDTGEEPWLVVDADGYATTLVAGNGFSGSQVFTEITTLMNFALNGQDPSGFGNTLANYGAGVPSRYPTGSYTFQFQGPGTFVLGGDAGSVAYASGGPSNVTVAGNTITSILGVGVT